MSDWFSRLKEEKDALEEKALKLRSYIDSKKSYCISEAPQLSIMKYYQLPAMEIYLTALRNRINDETVKRMSENKV